MKTHIRHLLLGLAALSASQAGWAIVPGRAECVWYQGTGPLAFGSNLNTVYVPRDALPGTIIGTADKTLTTADPNNRAYCWTSRDAIRTLHFEARPSVPIFPGTLPPINGEDMTGKILQTNIPGVGARIILERSIVGTPPAPNLFIPIGAPIVPFRAERPPADQLIPIDIRGLRHYIALIKTGPIPPGAHQLDGIELFSGHVSDLGRIFGFTLNGTVVQAQCSVNANPVSADPVRLGEWNTADFTGPGFTTTAVPFSIALSNCESDPTDGNIATAHIRLDGINGSQPVVPAIDGVFSLTTDSTAQGMGIQVLRADGTTPVPLNTVIPMMQVTPGNMALHFNARFYQTAPSRDVRPGLAKGALSFTLTYQ